MSNEYLGFKEVVSEEKMRIASSLLKIKKHTTA